jgi:DNA-binding transcriptional LysR family regulator
VQHEVQGLQRAAAGLDVLSGTVTLSAPPLLLQRLVLPALQGCLAQHPGLSLT